MLSARILRLDTLRWGSTWPELTARSNGPYTVVSKKSDVKYIIKDELDGQTIPVSVQQIVPFYGDDAVEGDEDDVVLQKSPGPAS